MDAVKRFNIKPIHQDCAEFWRFGKAQPSVHSEVCADGCNEADQQKGK